MKLSETKTRLEYFMEVWKIRYHRYFNCPHCLAFLPESFRSRQPCPSCRLSWKTSDLETVEDKAIVDWAISQVEEENFIIVKKKKDC